MSNPYTEDFVENVREQVTAYMSSGEGISQDRLSKMTGISPGALSSFLNGKYEGRNDNIIKKLLPVLEAAKNRETAMKIVREPEIIETSVMRTILSGINHASNRNDMLVIYGAPGIGKTVTLEKYVKANPSVIFFTASPNIRTGRDIIEELLEAVSKKADGRSKNLEKGVIAALKNTSRMIIIDEAHFLRLDGLETLRRIHDASKCPIVLVGNPKIMEVITEKNKTVTGQFFSRCVRIALDSKASMDDVKGIVLQNDVELADDCLRELHKIANNTIGALRVMTKLFTCAWAIANDEGKDISLDHIFAAKETIIIV